MCFRTVPARVVNHTEQPKNSGLFALKNGKYAKKKLFNPSLSLQHMPSGFNISKMNKGETTVVCEFYPPRITSSTTLKYNRRTTKP